MDFSSINFDGFIFVYLINIDVTFLRYHLCILSQEIENCIECETIKTKSKSINKKKKKMKWKLLNCTNFKEESIYGKSYFYQCTEYKHIEKERN